MPVPVWDCTDLSLLNVPLESVLSDDIWKKFDLDEPFDAPNIYGHQNAATASSHTYNNNNNTTSEKLSTMTMTMTTMMMSSNPYDETSSSQGVSLPEFYDKISCRESREIRHHDCMWAGLCISKEHNRTLPAKKDNLVNSKKVPAGRSLLISSRATNLNNQQQQQSSHQHHIQHQQKAMYQQSRAKDGLESDGDSARPETPQSSESESDDDDEEDDEEEDEEEEENEIEEQEEEEEEEEEEENDNGNIASIDSTRKRTTSIRVKPEIEDGPLAFKHDQISINEKLSECMTDDIANVKSAPVSDVTNQIPRKKNHYHQSNQHHHYYHHQSNVRIKIEDEQRDYHRYNSDSNETQHQCTIKNEPDNWNTLNDHCYHQPSSKKLEHLGVQTPSDSEEEIDVVTFEKPCRPAALPTYPSIADQQHFQLTVKSALKEKPATTPRPRGRPPSNGTPRKRSAPNDSKPSKRPKHRTHQNRSKVTKNAPPTPAASPLKSSSAATTPQPGTSRSCSSDDEPDTEKRSLHNNMERQRRIELRNAFEDLRLLVPEIEDKEKAPKVAILRQAAIYCDMLTEIDQATTARVMEMKRKQERLRARLSQLRRSLASTR